MSALEFLDLLLKRRLLGDKAVSRLRRQIEGSSKTVSAEIVANLLVKKGQLTADQAKQLLDAATPPPLPDVDEELGLAPDDSGIMEAPEPELVDLVDDLVEPVSVVEKELLDEDQRGRATGDSEGSPLEDDDLSDHGLPAVEERQSAVDELLADAASADAGRTIVTKRRGLAGLFGSLGPNGPRRKFSVNRWDSPLMLVGGGALLLLLVVGVALYFLLSRGTGDDAFQAANENYRQQSYGQAIGQFQTFVSDYPDHPKVSLAKVKIGTAKIWNQVERQQWQAALDAVRSELPSLVSEEAFAEARPELASLLPEIMEGFADRALSADDIPACEQYLDRANETFDEVNNSAYLPTSVRKGQQPRIEQNLAKLESAKRRINRDRELEKTVVEIRSAASQQRIARAYDLRKELLNTYPSLETDKRLDAVVLEITEAERTAVELIKDAPEPVTDERAETAQYRVALTNRRGDRVSELADQLLFVNAQGAIYGLKADDGRVLWRRHVGFASDAPPLHLTAGGKNDVIVVDGRRQELVRLDGRTGKTVWRLPCPGQLTQPSLQAGRIWVARSQNDRGHVMEIDPSTGRVVGGAKLPVPISVSPIVDIDRQLVIQPAAHSTVYVFRAQNWECLAVNYLGHLSESVSVAPAQMGDVIVIAENPGIDFSLLHILQFDSEQEGILRPLVAPLRKNGQIVVPLQTFGRRLMLATDQGKIQALELDVGRSKSPLRVAAEAVATVPSGSLSYFLLDGGRLWVGDAQLTRYELQTSRGKLVRKWLNSKGDRFVAPLELRGSTLFHQRQRHGRLGTTIAAIHIGDDQGGRREGEAIWEVDLGVPVAGEPFVNRTVQEINVVNGNGVLFAVGKDAILAGVVDSGRHEVNDPQLPPLRESIKLSDDLRVICTAAGVSQYVLLDTTGRQSELRIVKMEIAGQRPGALSLAYQQQLLVPTDEGAVYLLEPKTGKPTMAPFQAPSRSGGETRWLRPTLSESDDRPVLTDGRGNLYQLGIQSSPQPHLAAVQQHQLEAPFERSPVMMAETIFGVVRGSDHDILRRLRAHDSQLQDQIDLPGRVIWGPKVIGANVVLMTDQMQLSGFDDQRQTLAIESLTAVAVGEPVLFQRGMLIASVDGFLWHVSFESGQVLAKVDVGEALGTGPIEFSGNRFIVFGGDGTLHVVTIPVK